MFQQSPPPLVFHTRIEQIFEIAFNEHQKRFYPIVRVLVGTPSTNVATSDLAIAREWLAERRRKEGRTTLLALCFMERAAALPRERVTVWDHDSTLEAGDAFPQVLRALANRHPVFKEHLIVTSAYCTLEMDF